MKEILSDTLLDHVAVAELGITRYPALPESGDESVPSDFERGVLNSTMVAPALKKKVGQIVIFVYMKTYVAIRPSGRGG